MRKSIILFSGLWCLLSPAALLASSHQVDPDAAADQEITGVITQENVVSYPATFFERYQPQTALDMVEQIPGFRLENNNATRGIGNALGNLLINDRRPAAKQEQPADLLSRIPATSVQRIELISGQVREIDLRGQSNLVNVVLRVESDATFKWEALLRRTFGYGSVTPAISISVSDEWSGMDYNLGLSARQAHVGRDGTEDLRDGDGDLTEQRITGSDNQNTFYKGNFDASRWLGETLVRFNSNVTVGTHDHTSFSDRYPTDPARSIQFQSITDEFGHPFLELGLDMERDIFDDLAAKLIFLLYRGKLDKSEVQTVTDASGHRTLLRTADTYNVTTEGVSRLELDWAGIANHAIQLNMEAVYNQLEGMFSQTDDTGAGLVSVNVPGANSTVEETRGDLVLLDTWGSGDIELEYGLGAEVSTLAQSGDVDQQRSFFFLKPLGMLTWSPVPGEQTRLRMAREVSQLDLEDFISATVLEDGDLALGNPDIQPATTWITELSHERRISETVIKGTVFYHWISNVLDLLPLSADFEAPGNIGDGRRWGVRLEATLPLQWAGLSGARLKLNGRWQDSSVTDPVTGTQRVLSEVGGNNEPENFDVENEYVYSIDFRQDLENARLAWGTTLSKRAEQPKFRVNELEIYDEGISLNAFIETTRWLGIKINLLGQNLLDFSDTRQRRTFTGERDLSPLQSTAYRDQSRGPRIFLTFSGTY